MADPMDEPTAAANAQHEDGSHGSSDLDVDTFEDAPDTASVRSLTKRKAPRTTSRRLSQPSPTADVGKSELEQAFRKIRGRPTPAPTDDDTSSADDINDAGIMSEKGATEMVAAEAVVDENAPPTNGHQRDSSNTSELDNVNLDDDTTATSVSTKDTFVENIPPLSEREPATKTLSLSSFANALPSIPWSPSATPGDPPAKPQSISPSIAHTSGPAPGLSRKLTSPFTWLSRGSAQKDTPSASPPLSHSSAISPRRNTASSVATLNSNPEMMLSKLEEERNSRRGSGRNSLRDRFAMIRMREEAASGEGDKDKAAPPAEGTAAAAADTLAPSADNQTAVGSPSSPNPSVNPSLAPGTASGAAAGPSSIANDSVDWDLWQAVISEGPAAVARSSPEELNKAIATGIPNAIRGVIWQVLAQSKNEELEAVYQELVVRGTDREKTTSSSASSVHSGDSAPSASSGIAGASVAVPSVATAAGGSAVAAAATTTAGPPGASATDKETSEITTNRKKRAKEDVAALQKLEKVIRRDLGARTSYSKFATSQGLQEGLFGVCKAYALFDEAVGYAQGMNFLVMPILFNMPEEEAFCLLVRLMNQYHLRDLFVQDMPGLHMHLYIFERLLEDLEPALYCHLHRRGISPHLYATQWFLTLFAYRFPLQLVLRIYDLILSEGLSAILKFGIVLMQKNATVLLAMSDMSQLTTYLKDRLFDVYIDVAPSAGSILENGFFGSSSSSLDKEVYRADQFVRDACEVKLTPELFKMYTAEWEEKTRAEKDRETELETLRAANASLTVKVRKFEERIEAVDREQADLATELVRTKMQNEELQDENESLKGQVRELKLVIEQQPEQLEQAWKAERDDLMQRNAKVHDENQRVEKELGELEDQLVKTKMEYAEINAQHEALSRKWTDLKRQFL